MTAGLASAVAAGGLLGSLLERWARRLVKDDDVVDAAVVAAPPRAVAPGVFECATAALFALAWWRYGFSALLVSRAVFGCALILLFTIDWRRHRLPNAVTWPGIALGIGFSFVTEPGWSASLIGTALAAVILWTMAEVSHRLRGESGIGMGDVKMLAMVGAFIGWKLMLVALMVALLTGSTASVVLMATRRGAAPRVLPFGSFLSLGAAAAVAVGPRLIDWYWLAVAQLRLP